MVKCGLFGIIWMGQLVARILLGLQSEKGQNGSRSLVYKECSVTAHLHPGNGRFICGESWLYSNVDCLFLTCMEGREQAVLLTY